MMVASLLSLGGVAKQVRLGRHPYPTQPVHG